MRRTDTLSPQSETLSAQLLIKVKQMKYVAASLQTLIGLSFVAVYINDYTISQSEDSLPSEWIGDHHLVLFNDDAYNDNDGSPLCRDINQEE